MGRVWREPDDWPDGNRCKGGMSLIQALIRNMGTCSAMTREKTNCDIAVRMNTDALARGGVARSSVESSVMGLERRCGAVGVVVIGQPAVDLMAGRI